MSAGEMAVFQNQENLKRTPSAIELGGPDQGPSP